MITQRRTAGGATVTVDRETYSRPHYWVRARCGGCGTVHRVPDSRGYRQAANNLSGWVADHAKKCTHPRR